MQVLGCGVEMGTQEYEVEMKEVMELLPKQQINIVVEESKVAKILDLIKKELYTGHIGDGKICQGMAKMNMLPKIFSKTNKHNVPWFGQVFVSAAILVFGFLSDSSADMISFLILAGSVFWMISYILAHVDLLVFRKRLPNAPRNFKVPGGVTFPVIGIVGTLYMILNISSDSQEKLMIWLLTGGCFAVLSIYSAIWIKVKMKMKVFKSIPIEKVMAMENDLYYHVRKSKGIWK